MRAADPSEAVRSAEIEAALRSRFEVIGEWSWGGTINHLVFQDIAGNFDALHESHLSHVERLIQFENGVIREGGLPSDFKGVHAAVRACTVRTSQAVEFETPASRNDLVVIPRRPADKILPRLPTPSRRGVRPSPPLRAGRCTFAVSNSLPISSGI